MEQQNARTRMNLQQDSKGRVKFDITAEYPTPEESAENLGKAIDLVKKVGAEKGLLFIDPV